MLILVAIGSGVYRWPGVESQVFVLTFNVVLITLWHDGASVQCMEVAKVWSHRNVENYLASYFVDNSGVAEQYHHQWHQVCYGENGQRSSIVADSPRYTYSVDDVRAQTTQGYNKHWQTNPNKPDRTIRQTFLNDDLQNTSVVSINLRLSTVQYIWLL